MLSRKAVDKRFVTDQNGRFKRQRLLLRFLVSVNEFSKDFTNPVLRVIEALFIGTKAEYGRTPGPVKSTQTIIWR